MKRRTQIAKQRADRKKFPHAIVAQSKYGLKRRGFLADLLADIPHAYTPENCPGHAASTDPVVCANCGAAIEAVIPDGPEF